MVSAAISQVSGLTVIIGKRFNDECTGEIKMKILFMLTIVLISISMVEADYSIPWYTIDSGGGTSSGGSYQLTGTIGQPDAGFHDEAPYELLGGFWVGGPLCIVNLEHFATFASYWLDGPCNESNNWCGGADLNQLNDVDIVDLGILASEWLNICPFGWLL